MQKLEAKAAASEIFAPSVRLLCDNGFKCRIHDGFLTASQGDRSVHKNVQFRLLDYEPTWRYEVNFSVNWRDIYNYTWVKIDILPSQWKKVAIISTGTPDPSLRYDFRKLEFKDQRDFKRVGTNLSLLTKEVGLGFFVHWQNFRERANDFWEITQGAQSVVLVPDDVAMIGVSAGLIIHGEGFASNLARKYRHWLRQFDSICIRRFDEFMVHIQKTSSVKYP
jgi:hypothetical protein